MTSVAKQEAEPVRASILQEGKLLKELRDIERPGQKLTIEDVEQYRPRHRTPDPTSRSYPEEYQKVLQRLEKAFSRGQFYEIAKLFGELSPPVNKPKRVYATLVLEKWGWPSPSKTRTIEKEITLNPSELFLAAQHHRTTLAQWVRGKQLKVKRQSSPPLLYARGNQAVVKEIQDFIRNIQQDIATSRFTVPIDVRMSGSKLLTLSTSCGAFLEKISDSVVSISYLRSQPHASSRAERAILSRAYQTQFAESPTTYYQQCEGTATEESPYSVYPFAPMPSHPISAAGSPGYRIQRTEPQDDQGNVSEGAGFMKSLKDLESTKFDLHQWLKDLQDETKSELVVEASPGHVVMEPTTSKGYISTSPLPGPRAIDAVTRWVWRANEHRPKFYPTLPNTVFDFETVSSSSYQRLVYSEASPPTTEQAKHIPTPRSVFQCWINISEPSDDAPASNTLVLPVQNSPLIFTAKCKNGVVADLDVLVPDRDKDLRLTVSAMEELSSDQFPQSLQDYVHKVHAAYKANLSQEGGFESAVPGGVDPPLVVYHADKRFVLTSVDSVRRNTKHPLNQTDAPQEIVTDTITDFENPSGPGRVTCQVPYNSDLEDQAAWDRFLKDCEWLSRTRSTAAVPEPEFQSRGDILDDL